MSYFEFQVSSAAFLKAQRNALQQRKICLPGPFQIGPVQIVLDRLEFRNNALRHSVPTNFPVFLNDVSSRDPIPTPNPATGFQTQVAQDLMVFVTTLDDILQNPNQSPSLLLPIQATIVFDLDLFVFNGACQLRTGFRGVEKIITPPVPVPGIAVDPGTLLQIVTKQIEIMIPTSVAPFDMGDVAKDVTFLNAGISVDAAFMTVAFRAQVGGSTWNLDVPWSKFFQGLVPDHRAGNDWAFFLESGYLTNTIKTTFNRAIADAGVDHLQTFIGCDYSNAGGKAVFTVDALATYQLPGPLPALSSEVKVPITLSLDSPNNLAIDVDLSPVVSLIDSFLGILGVFLPILIIPLSSWIHSLVGSALSDAASSMDGCAAAPGNHIRCLHAVPSPKLPVSGSVTLTTLEAMDDGIALAGEIRTIELTPAVLDIGFSEFKISAPSLSCGAIDISTIALFTSDPTHAQILHASISVMNQGSAPLFLCDVSVVLDGLGVFPKSGVSVDGAETPIQMRLGFEPPGAAYYSLDPEDPRNAFYPCKVLIKTTAGTRLVSLGAPPKVTQADIDKLVAVLIAALTNCEKLVNNWFDKKHGYNRNWFVPDPPDSSVEHLWQFEVTGLTAGDAAVLIDVRGKEAMRALAVSEAPLRLSVLVAPAPGQNEVTLIYVGADSAHNPSAAGEAMPVLAARLSDGPPLRRGIAVGQQTLIRLGSIGLSGDCIQLLAANVPGELSLLVVVSQSIAAYDVRSPSRPALVGKWSFSDARGVVNWQGAALAFGGEGLAWIESRGLRKFYADRCLGPQIRAAAAAKDVLYAVTNETIEIYDNRLCRRREIEFENARTAARCGTTLLVGGPNGIAAFDIADPFSPRRRAAAEWLPVKRLTCPPMPDRTTVLAEFEDGSASMLQVTADHIEEFARFPRSPWFADAVRVHDLFVRNEGVNSELQLYRLGDSVVI